MRGDLVEIISLEDNVAGISLLETTDDIEESCLASPISAYKSSNLTGIHVKIYTIEQVERLFPGVRKTQLDIFNLQEHATSKLLYQTSPGGGNKPLR